MPLKRKNAVKAGRANRVRGAPLFSRTVDGQGRTPSKAEVRETVADAVRRESGEDPSDEPGMDRLSQVLRINIII
ncbi:hypothetical protein IGB19_21895 [Streptomyces sp. AC04842]|nr:hypothetical protein [Streptomyces sp. AC04842]